MNSYFENSQWITFKDTFMSSEINEDSVKID